MYYLRLMINKKMMMIYMMMIFIYWMTKTFFKTEFFIYSKLLKLPNFWQMTFFGNSNYIYNFLKWFHNVHLMMILNIILTIVVYAFMMGIFEKYPYKWFEHGKMLEFNWTLIPALSLFFIAIPSIYILYLSDEGRPKPYMSFKSIGHQWYWSYEFFKSKSLKTVFMEEDNFFMKSKKNYKLLNGSLNMYFDNETIKLRLLDVSNKIKLPTNKYIRILVSSTDVMHSWAIPNLMLKIDAIPGRINQNIFINNYKGVFFGQCSELCGPFHSFMPIVIEFI